MSKSSAEILAEFEAGAQFVTDEMVVTFGDDSGDAD